MNPKFPHMEHILWYDIETSLQYALWHGIPEGKNSSQIRWLQLFDCLFYPLMWKTCILWKQFLKESGKQDYRTNAHIPDLKMGAIPQNLWCSNLRLRVGESEQNVPAYEKLVL